VDVFIEWIYILFDQLHLFLLSHLTKNRAGILLAKLPEHKKYIKNLHGSLIKKLFEMTLCKIDII
jgi:hypothetical protein